MDKNTGFYIVLGFLLLCIFLSLDKKEGFVTINEDAFRTQCGVGHGSCDINISGARGFPCSINGDYTNYNIVGADGSSYQMPQGDEPTIFSGLFDDISLNPTTPCNETVAYPDRDNPSIGSCTSSNTPFVLSGCSAKCSSPQESTGYVISNPSIKIIPGAPPQEETSITCDNGYRPAKNVCFDKTTGNITGQTGSICTSEQNTEWYGNGDDQPVQISCNEPGDLFVPIGCEPLCQSRITNPTEYIINDNSVGITSENYRSLYDQNKELMQITSNRPDGNTGGNAEIPINIITDSPYNVQEDEGGGLDPINFGVTVDCESNACSSNDSGGQSKGFEGTGVSSTCKPNDPNPDIRRKYYVSGLFPTCSADNEECLNFNITYTPGEYEATDDTKPPFNLQELRDKLPTDIFQGDPSDEEIQKYRDSLYYFRGFKDSDGNYNVEGQIRCDIDQNSRYGCAIISSSLADVADAAAAEEIYEKYFKPPGVVVPSYDDNLYAFTPTTSETDSGVYDIFSDDNSTRPDYLIQKNGFCYTDGGTGVTVTQDDQAGWSFTPKIGWNDPDQGGPTLREIRNNDDPAEGGLMYTTLREALIECNRTNGLDADGRPNGDGEKFHPCKYITHNKTSNKYYIHRHASDSYRGPSHFAIHQNYNCIIRPKTSYTQGDKHFSGSYLMDGTENANYIGYKNTNCMGEPAAEVLDTVNCNTDPQCYGYQIDSDGVTNYFKKYSGRMTMLRGDNLNTTTCYLKNERLLGDNPFIEMSLPRSNRQAEHRAIRRAVRSVTDNWMTTDKKAPLQSYVLKTKGEITDLITGI